VGIVITVASQKGGVGKTTSAVNLAASLALAGREVCLLDFDPQGNASSGVGFHKPPSVVPQDSRKGQSKGFPVHGFTSKPLKSYVKATQFAHLHVVPAQPEFGLLELIQHVQGKGLPAFRTQVQSLLQAHEYLILDCPPSLGGMPTIALSVSQKVLIPVQCEYYAMEGLSQILPVIQDIAKETNADLSIGGLLLTMFSPELELSKDVAQEIRGYFKDTVFRTLIPRDVVLAEAASHGVPAFHYDSLSRGAWSYLELAREVLRHDWT
jgi:chromosome partitioning protein